MTAARTITASELDEWVRQIAVSFHFQVAPGYPEYMLGTIDLDRSWASFDAGSVVGTLRSFATPLTVPGPRELAASALTNVTVAPTHRREGRLTSMITEDLRASHARGEVVSILVASEYPIYGRFGYGPAIDSARYVIDTRGLRFRAPARDRVMLSDLATLRAEGPDAYDRFRRSQPGSIGRAGHWWDRRLRQVAVPGDEPHKGQVALVRSDDGELDGYVIYEGKLGWDGMRPQGTVTIEELVAVTPEAYRSLWQHCCGIDLMSTIEAPNRPVDEVLPYLVEDARHVKLTARHDFVWVRVLDTARALEGRAYDAAGHLVIDVVDHGGIAGGRFAVDGGPDGATVTVSTASPDLTLPIASLGSILLGGVNLRTLQLAGRVDEHRDGAVTTADAMFRTGRAPWCNTWF